VYAAHLEDIHLRTLFAEDGVECELLAFAGACIDYNIALVGYLHD